MQQSPFHAYYIARMLECLSSDDRFLPVFASSDITVYPFQIAAAGFTLRSPYLNGAVLCDEAGMGKSHEAMLIITQKWLEGQTHILIAVPNADLLIQWSEMIERYYTIPYIVLADREDWDKSISEDNPNAFEQDTIVLTTYDFAADNVATASTVKWDLTVFDEATALSPVYQENSTQAKTLKRIAGDSFKLLLTGTPIEKNIMDLYGLMYFIDESILPDEKEYLTRYLRKPENYPELAELVGKYCFRTLRSQAKHYAKVPERLLITLEYTQSAKERELYELLYAYINKPNKLAFPEMDTYDLALRLLGLQSSSTVAILQTVKGIIRRLESMPNAENELRELHRIQAMAESITEDAKIKLLLTVLEKDFALMKKTGANRKAVIFTESIETQKYLFSFLRDKYKTLLYNGSADYSVIRQFKTDGEVLISTDNGARGFNLEEAAFVIHYDLLYNTLKMEQRIDRVHRLGQENDVLSFAFIDKNNFSDVRKLELINKRMLVSDGVFGISDEIVGGFTDNISLAFKTISEKARTKAQIETDYQRILETNELGNKQLITAAEDILFTTFTKELADKIQIAPQYVREKSDELNAELWSVVKWFFECYNTNNTDCRFEIDEQARTVTATNYETLPTLFYYWDGSRNKKYQSLKCYGMAPDFKPHYGRITLSSIIGRGILHALECTDTGALTLKGNAEPCTIALYSLTVAPLKGVGKEYDVLVGKTDSGRILTQDECLDILSLPVVQYEEGKHKAPHWLRTGSTYHELDRLVPIEKLIQKQTESLSPAQSEEIDKMKLQAKTKKSALSHELNELDTQIKAVECERCDITNNRLKLLALDKRLTLLKQDLMKRQENHFFVEMQIDIELEKQIKEFAEKEKLTAKVIREFVVKVEVENERQAKSSNRLLYW
jgi:hypothetical protein